MSWAEIIGIVLGVTIVLFLILPAGSRVMNLFTFGGGQEEASAKQNLALLGSLVNQVAVIPTQFAASENFQYGLPNKYQLIAFNDADNDAVDACSDKIAKRPDDCKSGTCLCLYKDGVDEKSLLCEHFSRNYVFYGPGNREEVCAVNADNSVIPCLRNEYRGEEVSAGPAQQQQVPQLYQGTREIADWRHGWNFGRAQPAPKYAAAYDAENFALAGDCGLTAWKVQPVYIEKFADQGKTYVFLARQSPLTHARYELLNKAFVAQPIVAAPVAPPPA